MPQLLLPIFPDAVTPIKGLLSVGKEDGRVVYFHGVLPVFSHAQEDLATFRMITAQLIAQGHLRVVDVSRAFGVPALSVKRALKRYRQEGPKGFYVPPRRRGPAVLTADVLRQAQALLDGGQTVPRVAEELGIKSDTLAKAVRAGRLHVAVVKESCTLVSSTKSERSARDSEAPMGVAASNVPARVAASVGGLNAVAPQFQAAVDVPRGGVLFALPALLAVGLLEGAEELPLPPGYYGIDSLLMLIAFMALARLKSVESLRSCAPGEWGKLLGLDRIPEVRTLREKIGLLSQGARAEQWSADLCRRWMAAAPEQAGILYVDAHVRVYHGGQTELPRHYVARQRLCQRATADYWVNAIDGQPFFRVTQAVDPGLIKVLEGEILPRLERDIPDQPSADLLAADPLRHRFTLVFDREGYSPGLFQRLKARRVACLSYRKYPGDDWSPEEFVDAPIALRSGEQVRMRLAERGTLLGGVVWVREVRKLCDTGRQVALISTDYQSGIGPLAATLFARWSQENFFKYAREHFALDRLADYQTEEIPDTARVVNPARRTLDGQVRSLTSKLSRRLAQFGALNLDETIDPAKVEAFVAKKAAAHDEIEQLQEGLKTLKEQRKDTPSHLDAKDLPEESRFRRLSTHSKQLLDTLKMIAYRAETAMANVLAPLLARPDEARSLLRAIYTTEADLLPDPQAGTLTVRLHHLANGVSDRAVRTLCDELNATETVFPRSNLRLILQLGTSQNP
jgi:transposase-like protein